VARDRAGDVDQVHHGAAENEPERIRVVRQQPVPELIPERALGLGCAAGVALFLAGNFIAAHLVGR